MIFLQFRRLLPNAKHTELNEFFEDRKAWTIKYVEKVMDLAEDQEKGIKIRAAPKEDWEL
jgi:hypothetical protein